MMKEIKDFLHLYLGCDLIYNSESVRLLSVSINGTISVKSHTKGILNLVVVPKIKPLLRPLSSMTEKEARELLKVRYGRSQWAEPIYERHSSLCIDFKFASSDGKFNETQLDWDMLDSYSFKFLLLKHFDLFGLIDAGLAIDSTKQ